MFTVVIPAKNVQVSCCRDCPHSYVDGVMSDRTLNCSKVQVPREVIGVAEPRYSDLILDPRQADATIDSRCPFEMRAANG